MESTKRTPSRLSPAATPTTTIIPPRSPRLRRTVSGATSASSSLSVDSRPVTPSRPSSANNISRVTRSATTSPRPSIDRSSSSWATGKVRYSSSSSVTSARVNNSTSTSSTNQVETGKSLTSRKILTTSSSLRKLASTVNAAAGDDHHHDGDNTAVAKFLRKSSPHNLALKRTKSSFASAGSSSPSSNSPMSPGRPLPLLPPSSPVHSRHTSPSHRESTRMKGVASGVFRYFNKAALKKATPSPEEEEGFHQYRIMNNRLLQLRFANAKAQASMVSVKKKAEEKLFHVWLRLYKVRYSIAEKRARVDRLRLKIKLLDIVCPQVEYLDEWEQIEKRNIEAVGRVARKLSAYSTKLPLVNGAEGNVVDFYDAMSLSIEIMEDIEETIIKFFSQLNKICKVLRELISTMGEHKECFQELQKIINVIMVLETREQSLIAHLLQANKEMQNQSSPINCKFHDLYISFGSNKIINPLYSILNAP